ncbi:dTDP-4-dehydrorhamnose reductase [Streptomyces sp. NPDC057136]|uniref:dTDP-4-dehydrorhamnose reductase n=1 Tax=Streptomyces sp. NPDC057136 TaxID=3346029 RepID=UPI003636FFDC
MSRRPPRTRPPLTVLVTGAHGMLGRAVTTALLQAGHHPVPLGHQDLDITRADAVRDAFATHRPHTVVNCAAHTAVDAAETDEAAAHRLNAEGPRHLAEAAAHRDYWAAPVHPTRLIHISTDYVFDGDTDHPYPVTAPTRPRTAYGRTKLAGEHAVLGTLPEAGTVLRTAWLYGAHGSHFPATMARLALDPDRTVHVVADQYGQPTWTGDLATRIAALTDRPHPGVLHATNTGEATWYDLAREVFTRLGADPGRVRPVTTAEMPRPAPRPARTTLDHACWAPTGLPPLRDWRDALAAAWPTLGLTPTTVPDPTGGP